MSLRECSETVSTAAALLAKLAANDLKARQYIALLPETSAGIVRNRRSWMVVATGQERMPGALKYGERNTSSLSRLAILGRVTLSHHQVAASGLRWVRRRSGSPHASRMSNTVCWLPYRKSWGGFRSSETEHRKFLTNLPIPFSEPPSNSLESIPTFTSRIISNRRFGRQPPAGCGRFR